ncbi:MAG: hypothetical protein HC812_14640 [Leptolyngbya sp. RL_3_1]|nr:hypothetical protein [Leptolyngbya sp. RL_3_1]
MYFIPIALLAVYSFWRLESFDIVQEFSLKNFQTIASNAAYRKVLLRTVAIALGVTVIDGAIALPLAYFITRHGGRYRQLLTLLVILPCGRAIWCGFSPGKSSWATTASSTTPSCPWGFWRNPAKPFSTTALPSPSPLSMCGSRS